MSNVRLNHYRKLTVICAVVATILVQSLNASLAAPSLPLTGAVAEADIRAESRTLDTFVNDFASLDKQIAALNKKSSVTRAEFNALQSKADDLKRRLAEVQNALREMIKKLKAAGQWEGLDAAVLAKISDPKFQDFVRREGFKKTLEEVAAQLQSAATEISGPLDVLRNKVSARGSDSILKPGLSAFAFHAVRVAYTPAPALVFASFKCRLANLRFGVTGAILGSPSEKSINALSCYCLGSQAACDAL